MMYMFWNYLPGDGIVSKKLPIYNLIYFSDSNSLGLFFLFYMINTILFKIWVSNLM